MPLGMEEIASRFGTHKATIEGENASLPRHVDLRLQFQQFVSVLDETLPDGRDKSLAMTALEEASMWCHKAIAKTGEVEII